MENNPKVSVIMPCYNHGKYIIEAIDSVLAQTYQDFEIIVINDGSTDEYTKKVLQNLNKPKTQIINIENQGPSVARNIGIQQAKGEYILPLDSDDKIAKTYLEKAVKILDENPDVSIVHPKYKCFGANFWKKYEYTFGFPDFLVHGNITASSFFRKSDWEKVGGYNNKLTIGCEDYDFWLSLLELSNKVICIPEFLVYHRTFWKFKSRHNAMSVKSQKQMFLEIFDNHKNLYLDNIEYILAEFEELKRKVYKDKYFFNRLLLLFIFSIFSNIALIVYIIMLIK